MTSSSNPSSLRVAVVTGAARGIGAACATALLKDGWRVVYTGRDAATLQQAIDAGVASAQLNATAAAEMKSRALAVACDVSRPADVAALFARVKSHFGRLDLLFNNAGLSGPPSLLEDLSFEAWQEVVGTNLTGPFLCTQQAFAMMKAQTPMGGRIVNNGSISAYVPRPNSVAYTATKHAITGLTRTSSLDGRKYDIAVSQIDIGNAATDMTQRMTAGVPQADGSLRVEPRMPVENVANTLLHIANMPLDANVQFVTVMATKMPYIGRG
jgi:NAD(P)-dependent dehydrogenase (short-subunit alcohol dehydrogenase family)